MGWRMLQRTSTKRRLYQNYSSLSKKREENKTKNLQKPKLIWKQNTEYISADQSAQAVSQQILQNNDPLCGAGMRDSAPTEATVTVWGGRLLSLLHLRTAAAASLWLTESCLKGWKMGAIKCVQSLQCEAGTLLSSERIRCDFPTSLSELSKPPC